MNHSSVEDLEIKLLLEAIVERYGYDYRQYGQASLFRRINSFMRKMGKERISELIPLVLHDRDLFFDLVETISVTVTEMFRDPFVYKLLRTKVIPYLNSFPHINIWVAGCATGEEAYSIAILLEEEGVYDKCRIYATDINGKSLTRAREGIFPSETLKANTKNYHAAGGKYPFNEYYYTKYRQAKLRKDLARNIIFDVHNLTVDGVFNEMQLILCRNVLIYFRAPLQDKVLNLMHESLCPNGFLVLGSKEDLAVSDIAMKFVTIGKEEKIYKKKND